MFSHQVTPPSNITYVSIPLQPPSPIPKISKVKPPKTVRVPSNCLETRPYPNFKFNHMFSMLVVGQSQCGKTHFVKQMLTKSCIKYPNKKPRRIYCFFNQWQPCYTTLQSTLGDEINLPKAYLS